MDRKDRTNRKIERVNVYFDERRNKKKENKRKKDKER